MGPELIFANARIVGRVEVVRGSLAVRAGKIAAFDQAGAVPAGAIDLEGDYLLPGLIELHTDNFERHLMPRPKVYWPEFPALLAHDAEVASAGITTVFDALGVGDADQSALRGKEMSGILRCLSAANEARLLRADHRLHVRCEVPAPNTIELFEPFIDHPLVGLISLMDHTPGQRQWTDIEQARTYWTGKKGWTPEKFSRHLEEAPERQDRYASAHRLHFVTYARERGIPLASHDDTTDTHVAEACDAGMVISEFPTTARAARTARERKLSVVMGAPNIVRGGSHSGNVAAMTLAKDGLLEVLSLDYVPGSMLHAAFMIHSEAGLSVPDAIATVSANPARALGLEDRGEIAIGKRADLVQVRMVQGQPVVRAVWREGHRVG